MKHSITKFLGALTTFALLACLLAASSVAAPQLGVQLDRTQAPLHIGDERLVHEVTVSNDAGANPMLGDVLTCSVTSADSWGGRPSPTLAFKWLRDGTEIAGATTDSYTVAGADEGKAIQCVATGTNQSTPAGTADTEAGSNVIENVITATGNGTLTVGSKEIPGRVVTSGRFANGQTLTGECIQSETTIEVTESDAAIEPFKSTLYLSKPVTCSGFKSFAAGPGGFGPGAAINGSGIPPGTTVTASSGQSLTLSNPATATATGVAISGSFGSFSNSLGSQAAVVEPQPAVAPPSGSLKPQLKSDPANPKGPFAEGAKLSCQAPAGWTAGESISWSFQWLRNGVPAPHAPLETSATSSKYELQNSDVDPAAIIECEAIASAGGASVISLSPRLETSPKPPPPYQSPGSGDPTVDFANQATGPVTLDLEAPGGEETYVYKALGEGWTCTKQPPAPPAHATVQCVRGDSLAPQNSFPPVEVVTSVGANPPQPLITKAQVSGGGSPPASDEDEYAIPNPAIPFGFKVFETDVFDAEGNEYAQAGGHPISAGATLEFNSHIRVEKSDAGRTENVTGALREVRTDTPPGFVGNPAALTALCPSVADVLQEQCPAASAVGGIFTVNGVTTGNANATTPIYALEPERGRVALFAFKVAKSFYTLVPELRPENGYAIRLVTPPLAKNPEIYSARVDLCGFGAKLKIGVLGEIRVEGCRKPGEPGAFDRPFLTLPTKCGDPASATTKIFADSWQDPGTFAQASYTLTAPEGCEDLSFEPEIEARPTTNRADSPSGLDFNLHIPQNEDPEGTATAHLKAVTVTLPEGLVVNPSGANGLDACTESQLGMAGGVPDDQPVRCPDASKIGSVSVTTPILDHTLPGTLYIAAPHDNPFDSLLALYLVIESPADGLTIKLAGEVEADQSSGRLTASFDQNPQAPVEDVELRIRGGAAAPLRTPGACAKYTVSSSLTPWSAPDSGPPATPKDSWQINRGPSGGACASVPPNAPAFEAGSASAIAALHTSFLIRLSREDGTQRFSQVTVSPPPGVLAKLAGTAPCSEAALAAARAKSGREEQASPSCPPASELGSVIAAAGAGPAPYQATGTAYLTPPYRGAPLSIAIITPAVAGPFDLGNVVVRSAAYLDPTTAQVTVRSDPLPEILEGIPLDIRSATVAIDRPEFILNPTSCDEMAVSGELLSTLGQSASLKNRFQVAECSRLGFKPSLKLRLAGQTERTGHPQLSATLKARPGDANIAYAQVTLPPSAFLENAHIRTVCTRVQFAADQCPPGSVYGRATATTPLLDEPLTGPVYLRSSSNELPDLLVALKGPDSLPVEVELAGRTDSHHRALRNTFAAVPDAPVSSFRLELFGGRKGLIVNSRSLCQAPQRATVLLRAHNGAQRVFRPLVGNGCKKKRARHS